MFQNKTTHPDIEIGMNFAKFALERALLARFGHVKTSFAAALTLC